MGTQSFYKMPNLDKGLNKVIELIFYFRIPIVIVAVFVTSGCGLYIWFHSTPADHLKNVAVVLTGGSFMIGIFYSIINYEHNKYKFTHDVRSARMNLTYNTAAKFHDDKMVDHIIIVKDFYKSHTNWFTDRKVTEIENFLYDPENIKTRVAFTCVMNYFEFVSVGIVEDLMDNDFMKGFLKTQFFEFHQQYLPLIDHIREKAGKKVYKSFIGIIFRWQNED